MRCGSSNLVFKGVFGLSRKLIFLSVALLFLLGNITSSLAETTTTTAKKLTLDEAFDLALQNNTDLLKARIDYESAMVEAEQADYYADEIQADTIDNLQTAQTKYVSTKQKALAEEVAKQVYEIAKEQTKNTVEKNYYDVLKADNLVKVKETAVKRAQEEVALVQKKFKAGSAIKTDVNRAEIGLANARADLANAQRDYKNAQVALNQTIGLDVNTDIKPAQVLKYEKVTLPTVDELSQKALESRLDLQKARNTESIAKLNYDLVVSYQALNTFTARKNKTELDRAKLDLLQQEQNVRAEVISTLFQVQKADEVVGILAKSLDQAKDNHSLAKRRYEIGVGTYVDVLTASVDLADAEAKYIEAVYNYTLAKNQLRSVIIVSK